jgi:hypothetical protein
MQVALNAVESLVKRYAMDFIDQLVLATGNEFRDHCAENNQRGHRFDDGDDPRESDRDDIAIADRGRRHEAEV